MRRSRSTCCGRRSAPLPGSGCRATTGRSCDAGRCAAHASGVDRRLFSADSRGDAGLNAVAEGASTRCGPRRDDGRSDRAGDTSRRDDEMTVLLHEFKVDIAAYLAVCGALDADAGRPDRVQRRALRGGAACFGQELFDAAEATNGTWTTRPTAPPAHCLR